MFGMRGETRTNEVPLPPVQPPPQRSARKQAPGRAASHSRDARSRVIRKKQAVKHYPKTYENVSAYVSFHTFF